MYFADRVALVARTGFLPLGQSFERYCATEFEGGPPPCSPYSEAPTAIAFDPALGAESLVGRSRVRSQAAIGLLLLAQACTHGDQVSEPRQPAASESPAHVEAVAALPDVAEVVCDRNGTRILTAAVRPRPDAVHVRVENRTGLRISFVMGHLTPQAVEGVEQQVLPSGNHLVFGEWASKGDNTVGLGAEEVQAWIVQPGPAAVWCHRYGQQGDPADVVTGLSVVDTEGLYAPADLDCMVHSYWIALPAEVTDPVQAVSESVNGLQENDVVTYGGYPHQPRPIVRILRGGRAIALVHFGIRSDGVVNACHDSELTPR
jgi:hypothetical protein